MVSQYVTTDDLRVGLAVEYLGQNNSEVVLGEEHQAAGLILYSGHPGRIWDTTMQHVQATWVGLEDEPATYAVGFSVSREQDKFYPGLGLIREDEFARREQCLREALRSGRRLSGTIPPWRHDT